MSTELYDPIRTMRKLTREVLVGFSGGKDSCVTLDLCMRFFDRVVPFFLYQVPGMSFQEKTIRIYEDKYGVEVLRLPHFETSNFLRYGVYREPDMSVPLVSTNELYDFIRKKTGIWYIAGGERCADSIVRNAMIKHSGAIDMKRGRLYPLAYWKKDDIRQYMTHRRLYLGQESKKLGFSFRSLDGETLWMLKRFYPQDYERVKRIYPLCESAVRRFEASAEKQV